MTERVWSQLCRQSLPSSTLAPLCLHCPLRKPRSAASLGPGESLLWDGGPCFTPGRLADQQDSVQGLSPRRQWLGRGGHLGSGPWCGTAQAKTQTKEPGGNTGMFKFASPASYI